MRLSRNSRFLSFVLHANQAASPVAYLFTFLHDFEQSGLTLYSAVIGRGEVFNSSSGTMTKTKMSIHSPWTSKLKSPAVRNMDEADLKHSIELAEALVQGKADLVELNKRSLQVRGKVSDSSSTKRKRAKLQKDDSESSTPKYRTQKKGNGQLDIGSALGASPVPIPMPPTPAPVDPGLANVIQGSDLTSFRKRVLLALCQVPVGRVSTYLALSNYLQSSPRAVGNALRNNPFAPRVPCHRIVAADSGIGGFGGAWGIQGEYYSEKVKLLKMEGVKLDEKKGKICGNNLWNDFA